MIKHNYGDKVDVCLITEGSYPYVRGGVSNWVQDLIMAHSHLSFHVVSIMPEGMKLKSLYHAPSNLTGVTHIEIQKLHREVRALSRADSDLLRDLKPLLMKMSANRANLEDFRTMLDKVMPYRNSLGSYLLLDSEEAFNMILEMYEETMPEVSFLDYFWSARGLLGSFYSVMLAEIPYAKVYHTTCTGYAGLLAARAHLQTGRPVVLTEHGIYTSERRIEIASVDWLERDTLSRNFTIDRTRRELRDLWMDTFTNYSRICYQAASRIVTLFKDNQQSQIEDGAAADKMMVIPNGIDVERFANLPRPKTNHQPTIAFIGRVVPIKDVKTFIRTCRHLVRALPDLRAYIMGPTEEDMEYFQECQELVRHLALENTITFTGNVNIDEYLPEVDVVVLTSISESQPLVILEAGAAGIPVVATNVGACREMIEGADDEDPYLGVGGTIVPLSNPSKTARAIYRLLSDQAYYNRASSSMRMRVEKLYHKQRQFTAYQNLYNSLNAG